MARWLVAALILVLSRCESETTGGGGTTNIAERCTAILQWSFQEGNALSEHPEERWYRRNCD